jgi:hypothetical protein
MFVLQLSNSKHFYSENTAEKRFRMVLFGSETMRYGAGNTLVTPSLAFQSSGKVRW